LAYSRVGEDTVLSPDIAILDIDARHWRNLIKLFGSGKDGRGNLLVFQKDGECVKAIHTKRGAILDFVLPDKEHWGALLEEIDADRMGIMPIDLPRKFLFAAQGSFFRDDDWDHQIMMIIEALKPFVREEIEWFPGAPNRIPELDPEKIDDYFDKFWPDKSCVGFFVFEGRRPYTSVILGKNKGRIDLFTTLDAFQLADGPLDWGRDAKRVAEICAEIHYPLHAALWIELETLREMTKGGKPISFLRLARSRGRAALWPAPVKWRLYLWLARVFRGY